MYRVTGRWQVIAGALIIEHQCFTALSRSIARLPDICSLRRSRR